MRENLNQITSCEVCGNSELYPVLDLGLHPMCDDLVAVESNRVCNEYPIEILFCKQCNTAHQKYQVPKRELFPIEYHYRSRFTADVLNGMKALVTSCKEVYGTLSGKKVLDIGCNDGSLLDFFKAEGAITFGIEPTGAFKDAADKSHIVFNEYFSPLIAEKFVALHGKPDFITFTNVFAHIENLQEVIDALKHLVSNTTKIVIENHYLGAVLDRNQFDTFYHEHPRTYSYTSFEFIAKKLNISVEHLEFPSRYGGNIQVFLGNGPKNINHETIQATEQQFYQRFQKLAHFVENWKRDKGLEIDTLVKEHGTLKAKAFPGRSAILVKLLGLDSSKISAVYEKPGSLKIGHYLPGTRIPIHSDDELFAENMGKPIINLAWHISAEISIYLRNKGYKGKIVTILDPDNSL